MFTTGLTGTLRWVMCRMWVVDFEPEQGISRSGRENGKARASCACQDTETQDGGYFNVKTSRVQYNSANQSLEITRVQELCAFMWQE